MTEFKIGDRVRVIDNKTWSNLPLGSLATITKEKSDIGPTGSVNVRWDTYSGSGIGIYARRFELVEPELTDEELAAKYRKIREECHKTWVELKERGYSISGATATGIKIAKWVEEQVPVIKIEKVKKEL